MDSLSLCDQSLLAAECDEGGHEEANLYQQLLLQAAQEIQSQVKPDSKPIKPEPGFCVKTKTSDGGKVFVNICQSTQIPPPPDISEAELVELLQSEDPSGFRVPMSLGEPHAEIDNSSSGCTAYDVVINPEFFNKTKGTALFLEFLIAVVFEGLENKYELQLCREWKVLKNRKFLGSIADQNIRAKPRPGIQELENRSVTPSFLDLGEDRLVLSARPSLYHLDCFLPFIIDPESSAARHHLGTRILTVTMPVIRCA
ncbi:PIH1 domain-containing protein 1 [Polyodon spathula]|uniref:PIH1 domain-containing protein 1 n=1 Tax=Polyodon spathula TaxID=7913 RepID=UPI001B7E561A|nr:PIH1 domain-containing protein 1 [Polyodon spathula]